MVISRKRERKWKNECHKRRRWEAWELRTLKEHFDQNPSAPHKQQEQWGREMFERYKQHRYVSDADKEADTRCALR
jgi:hypothetical protein